MRGGGCLSSLNCQILLKAVTLNSGYVDWTLSLEIGSVVGGTAWLFITKDPLIMKMRGDAVKPPFDVPFVEVNTAGYQEITIVPVVAPAEHLSPEERHDMLNPVGSDKIEVTSKIGNSTTYRVFHFNSKSQLSYHKKFGVAEKATTVDFNLNLHEALVISLVHWTENNTDTSQPNNYFTQRQSTYLWTKPDNKPQDEDPGGYDGPATAASGEKEGKRGLSIGVIAGIVIAILIVITVLSFLIWWGIRKHSQRNKVYKTDVVREAAGFDKVHIRKSKYVKRKPKNANNNEELE